MKKISILIMAAATVFASCAKEEFETPGKMVDVIINVSTGADTKVAFDGQKLVWNTGDQITVIDTKNNANTFTYIGEDGAASGAFKGQITDTYKAESVVYPVISGFKYSKSRKSYFDTEAKELFNGDAPSEKVPMYEGNVLPTIQYAVKGTFGKGYNVSSGPVTVSGNSCSASLKSDVALIKVTVPGSMTDIKSITVSTSSGDPLTGKFSLYKANINLCHSYILSPEATLQNENGSALEPGDYYLAVLPTANGCDKLSESKGFQNPQLIVTNMAGQIAHKTIKDSNVLESGKIYTIPDLEGNLTFKDCKVITLPVSEAIKAIGSSHIDSETALWEDLPITVDGHDFILKGFTDANRPEGFTKAGNAGWYGDSAKNRIVASYYKGSSKVTDYGYLQFPDAFDGYYLYSVHFCSLSNNRSWEIKDSYPRTKTEVAFPCRLRGVAPDDADAWYNLFTKKKLDTAYFALYIIGTGPINGDITCTYVKE